MRRFRIAVRVLLAAALLLPLALVPVGAAVGDTSTGTAFVVGAGGYLLTCAHVVEKADTVDVVLGGKTYRAVGVTADAGKDIAIIQIEAVGLTPLPLGDSDTVEQGEEVRALGFALAGTLGGDLSVTRGTISKVFTNAAGHKSLQTDAAVNPGNSGGPLVRMNGEVLGVVGAKLRPEFGGGIGFAVPIGYVRDFLRANGIPFAADAPMDELTGPGLVKRIGPSVAFVKTKEGALTKLPAVMATHAMQQAQADALAELAKAGVASPAGMALVPGGAFSGEDGERTLNAFWIDRTEVTNAQFAAFVAATGYRPEGPWAHGGDALPAVNVSWNDATAYAKWAGKRLPSAAEWEKAARGTDKRQYPWGNGFDAAKANAEGQADGFKDLAQVGTFTEGASPWGALDLAGNAWEWTADGWEHADSLSRVARGGSYLSVADTMRTGARAALLSGRSLPDLGFRCAKDEPKLPVMAPPVPPLEAKWQGEWLVAGTERMKQLTPAVDTLTVATAAGRFTVPLAYVRAFGPREVELLGGSKLKGAVTPADLPVRWTLGTRTVDLARVRGYARSGPPAMVSVAIRKDGSPVPFAADVTVTLADGTALVGAWAGGPLRLRAGALGDLTVEIAQLAGLEIADGRATVALKDGNSVKGLLLGNYPVNLLEGRFAVPGSALEAIAFGGVGGGMMRTRGAHMVYVPAGEFTMGNPDGVGSGDERPQRKVYLDAYYIDETEVTVAAYREFCEATERAMPTAPDWGWIDKHPIVNVSWDDATAYAKWAGKALPTEAQWEKAARGTDGRAYPWGNDWDAAKAQCSKANWGDAGKTVPVGGFPEGKSPYGCLDMAGNVWEWCADWYANTYDAAQLRNPRGAATGTGRVLRGGSWYIGNPVFFRAAFRSNLAPSDRYDIFGFRCVSRQDERFPDTFPLPPMVWPDLEF